MTLSEMCRCAYCLNEFRSGDLLEITKEFAMKNLNFAAVFFLFAYVIGSSWARDGDGEVDPGGPTRESDCWVTVWSTAYTLCGEGCTPPGYKCSMYYCAL